MLWGVVLMNQLNPSVLIYIAVNNQSLSQQIKDQLATFNYASALFDNYLTLFNKSLVHPPCLMIIEKDWLANEIDNIQNIKELLEMLPQPVPIIYLSQKDNLNERLACVRAFGEAFLSLPVEFSTLLEKVDQLTLKQTEEPYRIFILEESNLQAKFIENALNNDGMLTCVLNDPSELMKALVDFRPELILTDLSLSQCTGLEIAKVIRQQEAYVGTPIIFLSSQPADAKKLNALLIGGDDFISQPIGTSYLISAIRSRAMRARTLRSLMIRDGLTGALNHTSVLDELEIKIACALRHNTELSFAMLDIDHFKEVNDRFGHSIGDRVIKGLAHLLHQRLRKTDIIGRYGGEEFAVILPNTSIDAACQLIDEIRKLFSEITYLSVEPPFKVTLSAGVVNLNSQNAKNMIELADQALYKAKDRGRNRVITC